MLRKRYFWLTLALAACGSGAESDRGVRAVGAFASDPSIINRSAGATLSVLGRDGVVLTSVCEKSCASPAQFSDFFRDAGAPPPGAISAPALASWSQDRLDVFVLGRDHAVWHQTWDRTYWLGWESLGGAFVSAPSAVSWAEGRIDVFAVGREGILQHAYCVTLGIPACRNSNWVTWEIGLGKPAAGIQGDPHVVSVGNERLDVVVLGRDGAAYHIGWDKGWSGWSSLGGHLKYAPTLARVGSQLEAFGVDSSGKLLHAPGASKKFKPFKDTGVELEGKPVAVGATNGAEIWARQAEGATLAHAHCDAKGRCKLD